MLKITSHKIVWEDFGADLNQLFITIYYYLDKSDYLLRKTKEIEGLDVLLTAYNYAKKIKKKPHFIEEKRP